MFDEYMAKVKQLLQETSQKFVTTNQRIPTESNQQVNLQILSSAMK